MKYLLGLEDVSVNKSDKSGTTPLFAAVSANNREITEMLLQKEDIRVNSTRIQSNVSICVLAYITNRVLVERAEASLTLVITTRKSLYLSIKGPGRGGEGGRVLKCV